MIKIPLMDLQAQYESIKPDIDQTVGRILTEANFVGGPEKLRFEQEFSAAIKVSHTVGVGNGTDAIFLVLKALGIGGGDKVVTAANSFIASSEAITASGAQVVFCDVEESSALLDLNALEEILKKDSVKVGGKIKAVLPVHLYGRLCDMDGLMSLAEKYSVQIIEDSAQAHLAQKNGRFAGTFGVAATFSFYPGKNLGAYGDAGAVVTNDKVLAEKIQRLADHGRVQKYDHDIEGFNSRLDTLQAAVLRVKLRHLSQWTEQRIKKAQLYSQLMKDIPKIQCPIHPPHGEHVFHLYVVRVPGREEVLKKLQAKNIFAGVHYPISLPLLKAYRHLGHQPKDFPVAYKLSQEILSLPLYPEISAEAQSLVVRHLKEALQEL